MTCSRWLSDHESDAFFVGTCNDISKLPAEFSRGTLRCNYFLDLPGATEKEPIWRMYLERFGLDPAQRRPLDRDWTGAEIRSLLSPGGVARYPAGRGGAATSSPSR